MTDVAVGPLRALVEAHREEIRAIVARNTGTDVALFGSVARGEERPDSDVDLLAGLAPDASLFDLGRILLDVRDLPGVAVDVVDRRGMLRADSQVLVDAVALRAEPMTSDRTTAGGWVNWPPTW